MDSILENSSILITGGTGSWGQELAEQLLKKYAVKEIKIFSRGEQRQVEMKRKFQDSRIKYFVGDVRDKDRLKLVSDGADYVFHLAALKHVPVCEENPWETVQTNIIGIQNLIEAAIENEVKKVIYISSDKAVDPFNLYGVTKACGEKLIIAANLLGITKFVCFRAGNVIGTNGSVVPLFHEQILELNKVTLTDEKMSRFFMRLGDVVGLLIQAMLDSNGGEIFVTKMPACRIMDLAKIMVDELGNKKSKIKTIGIRPGEKLHEVLVSKYEMPRTLELGNYFIILPQIQIEGLEQFYKDKKYSRQNMEEFNSNNAQQLSMKGIKSLLKKDGWLDPKYQNEVIGYLRSLKKKDLESYFVTEGWTKKKRDKAP
jgi:UDP-N-acetylglucosamine 4,6-dehydratase